MRPSPSPPPSQALPSVRFRPDRLRQPERQRQPSSQEMDIFEQQEMSKSRPRVKEELKGWYDWLVSSILECIKQKASRAFKTFKDKITGLYKRVKGKEPKEEQNEEEEPKEEQNEESFNPFRA